MNCKCSSDDDDRAKEESVELLRAAEQDLTFYCLQSMIASSWTNFNEIPMAVLPFKTEDGLFSTLAYLFSDQNPYQARFAFFESTGKGNDCRKTYESRISGALTIQVKELYDCLCSRDFLSETYDGPTFEDIHYYPYPAVRDVLMFAYAHRDYTSLKHLSVEVFPDRIEIAAPGAVDDAVQLTDIQNGAIHPRNKYLARALDILQLFDGLGLRTIDSFYRGCDQEPQFIVEKGFFKFVLPTRKSAFKKPLRLTASKQFKRLTLAERLEKYKGALPYKTAQEIEEDRQWLRMPSVGRELQ